MSDQDDEHQGKVPRIMVFRPTIDEMKDFCKYIEYMESQGANKAGLAKIIPPAGWTPRKQGYDDVINSTKIKIKSPIEQQVHGRHGVYQSYNIERKTMSVLAFKKLAESSKFRTPEHFDYDDLEREYWKNITYTPPLYGADFEGSFWDADCEEFKIPNLNSCLDLVCKEYDIKIQGVNTPYLYFGMYKAFFALHTEDMDLYSINYLHFGEPKSWYSIPPEYGFRFERLLKGWFPDSYQLCPAFPRHKTILVSPQVLKANLIPFNKITQTEGEFMITFPFSYHAGYNHGFNCAESTNFALPRWVEYGKRATRCTCSDESVQINMECFIKKYQPERYKLWREGKDIGPHPENPHHIAAAPLPDFMITNKTKSKRQAATNKNKCSTSTKTDDPDYNVLSIEPTKSDHQIKQDKSSSNDDCTDQHRYSSILNSNTCLSSITQPKVIIKQNAEIVNFLRSSAFDQLCEETKLNVTIPIDKNKNNDQTDEDHSNNNSSNTTRQPSPPPQPQFTSWPVIKTKAALKMYETEDKSNKRPESKDDTIFSPDTKRRKLSLEDLKTCFRQWTSQTTSTITPPDTTTKSNQLPSSPFHFLQRSTSHPPSLITKCFVSNSSNCKKIVDNQSFDVRCQMKKISPILVCNMNNGSSNCSNTPNQSDSNQSSTNNQTSTH